MNNATEKLSRIFRDLTLDTSRTIVTIEDALEGLTPLEAYQAGKAHMLDRVLLEADYFKASMTKRLYVNVAKATDRFVKHLQRTIKE